MWYQIAKTELLRLQWAKSFPELCLQALTITIAGQTQGSLRVYVMAGKTQFGQIVQNMKQRITCDSREIVWVPFEDVRPV